MQPSNTSETTSFSIAVNAIVQFFAFFVYMYYDIIWPYYVVMFLLGILVAMQTIGFAALAALSSSYTTKVSSKNKEDLKMRFLLTIAYTISCYQLYIIGYTIFAVVAFTHISINLLEIIFRSIKE
jgi:MFS family permease